MVSSSFIEYGGAWIETTRLSAYLILGAASSLTLAEVGETRAHHFQNDLIEP